MLHRIDIAIRYCQVARASAGEQARNSYSRAIACLEAALAAVAEINEREHYLREAHGHVRSAMGF